MEAQIASIRFKDLFLYLLPQLPGLPTVPQAQLPPQLLHPPLQLPAICDASYGVWTTFKTFSSMVALLLSRLQVYEILMN